MNTPIAPNEDLSRFSLQGKDLADLSQTFDTPSSVEPDLKKQQMLAKLLQGMRSKDEPTQTVGGWAVPQSGMQGLNNTLSSMIPLMAGSKNPWFGG